MGEEVYLLVLGDVVLRDVFGLNAVRGNVLTFDLARIMNCSVRIHRRRRVFHLKTHNLRGSYRMQENAFLFEFQKMFKDMC